MRLTPFSVQLTLLIALAFLNTAQVAFGEPGGDLGTAFDDAVYGRPGGDYARRIEVWLKKFQAGKIADADRYWAGILRDCAGREEIGDFLEFVNMQTWFADDEKSKPVDPEKAYQHLLDTTEKLLGKEHRFVADICTFLALYAESRNDFKRAKELRLRDLRLHEKAFGRSNHQVYEAYQEVGQLLVHMKEYREAEPYLKTAMVSAEKYKRNDLLQKARRDFLELARATKGGGTSGVKVKGQVKPSR